MQERRCQSCGGVLAHRGRGRTSVYCSAACRQRAYRLRSTAESQTPAAVLADIKRQVAGLALEPPAAFRADAEALAASARRLRRLAQNVTQVPVTKSAAPPPRLEDEADFASLVGTHRAWLHLHCYRMVSSYDDAEDLVQETLLKAWRDRSGFEGRAATRTWLYRIATNVCIDHCAGQAADRSVINPPRRRPRRPGASGTSSLVATLSGPVARRVVGRGRTAGGRRCVAGDHGTGLSRRSPAPATPSACRADLP